MIKHRVSQRNDSAYVWLRVYLGSIRCCVIHTYTGTTDNTLSETADPKAQSHFTLKVGVRQRPGTPDGHAVKIIVSFYDLTKDNKMMPTNAQVGYRWLTSASDWKYGAPRFLEATYTRPKIQMPASDGRRY